MRILVTGGAASGKSALAERYSAYLGSRLLYIATMRPYGEEGHLRVKRHRAQRERLGFDTLECYRDLDRACVGKEYGTILLECLGNLCANEMFDAPGNEAVAEKVVQGVLSLSCKCDHLVVVTNEIGSGAERYQDEMEAYLSELGKINRRLAADFDVVVEAVCGLPVVWKGKGLPV